MTEIRSVDGRSAVGTMQVIGQLPPPPPAKAQRASISQNQKQTVLKRDSETSIQQTHLPAFAHTVVPVISCPAVPNAGSVSPSPTDGHSSPKHLLSSDRWQIYQNQDGRLSWTQFEERHQLLGNEEDSSERHSSDEDFDIWCITDEQRDYYTNQFKSMQSDLNGKITGSTAKDFFEKSKLPVLELSKIWQLSDVDKDGSLSLEEFCTAMHLVVLRRNNIELPEVLPASLVPKIKKKSVESVAQPNNSSQVQQIAQNQNESSPKPSPSGEVVSPQNKEWTKFNDSPTSSLSSPGMKPVNFDFSAASVEQNPKILHPVALRLSPERQPDTYQGNSEEPPAVTDDINKVSTVVPPQVIHKPKPRKPLGPSLSVVSQPSHTCNADFEGASTHNTSSSFSGTSNATRSTSLSQGAICVSQGPKKEPPPPPPPRPKHNHIRSSSLDLNKLGSTVPHFLSIPPAVPPRISPSTATPSKSNVQDDDITENADENISFADFSLMSLEDTENAKLQLQLNSGAFEVYKKPFSSPTGLNVNSSPGSETCLIDQSSTPATADDSTALLVDMEQNEEEENSMTDRKRHLSAPPLALAATAVTSIPQEKRELLSAVRAHRERNMMLSLVNNELNQELSEIMEERIALEIQLEQLKPFS